jgi:hypothetical protein
MFSLSRNGSPRVRPNLYAQNMKHIFTNLEKIQIMKDRYKNKDGNLRYNLMVELSEGTYKCLICLETIQPVESIWTCPSCYVPIHLNCAEQWARRNANSSNSSKSNKDNKGWKCPNCRLIIKSVPSKYLCYCGKKVNPKFDEYILPHSCGGICGKTKPCKHICKEKCHPGPCSTCREIVGYKKCHCGRNTFQYLCCDPIKETRSCKEICGRLLNCGLHCCNLPCHPGPCEDCAELTTESCMCGQEVRFAICGKKNTYVDSHGRMFTFKNYVPGLNLSFVSCGRPCKRIRKDCGHVCGRICHVGRCMEYPCTGKCEKIKKCGHKCDKTLWT